MATQRRVLFAGSLAGVLLTAAVGCGSGDVDADYSGARVAAPSAQAPSSAALPAVSGGTLLLLADNKTAVAADPDRDVVWLADYVQMQQTGRIDLQRGDEPGRLVQDGAGKVHVALRRGGAVVTIDPVAGSIVMRRPACPAPRGIAYDPASDRLHVACAGGELVTFAASGGDAVRTLKLDSDLRDVLVSGSGLVVSRFRSAELLTLDAAGTITNRARPASISIGAMGPNGDPMLAMPADPSVAWQIRPLPDGKIVMLFERGTTAPIDTMHKGGYGHGQCGSIISAALTVFGPSGEVQPGPTLPSIAYAVDFAIPSGGQVVSVAVPGNSASMAGGVMTLSAAQLSPQNACDLATFPPTNGNLQAPIVALAYTSGNSALLQFRNPARLQLGSTELVFKDGGVIQNDGHALFHTPTASGIACASCHPEGGDDGRVWNFTSNGVRRTQNLRGGLLATAPFHWDGDMTDMHTLMNTVFVGRMGGQLDGEDQVDKIAAWLDSQPELPKSAPADPQAVTRGQSLFSDAKVGCASCHNGAHFTNNTTVNVGTSGSFQVPSLLGLASRAPYLHNGCAATLADRFDPNCGGASHGNTAQLDAGQLADLTAYLNTL